MCKVKLSLGNLLKDIPSRTGIPYVKSYFLMICFAELPGSQPLRDAEVRSIFCLKCPGGFKELIATHDGVIEFSQAVFLTACKGTAVKIRVFRVFRGGGKGVLECVIQWVLRRTIKGRA